MKDPKPRQATLFEKHILAPLRAARDFEDTVRTLARRADPPTSKAAAAGALSAVAIHEAKILEALAKHGPGTKDDLATWTGISDVGVARRMRKLERTGFVAEAGTGPLESGRAGILWKVA